MLEELLFFLMEICLPEEVDRFALLMQLDFLPLQGSAQEIRMFEVVCEISSKYYRRYTAFLNSRLMEDGWEVRVGGVLSRTSSTVSSEYYCIEYSIDYSRLHNRISSIEITRKIFIVRFIYLFGYM